MLICNLWHKKVKKKIRGYKTKDTLTKRTEDKTNDNNNNNSKIRNKNNNNYISNNNNNDNKNSKNNDNKTKTKTLNKRTQSKRGDKKAFYCSANK